MESGGRDDELPKSSKDFQIVLSSTSKDNHDPVSAKQQQLAPKRSSSKDRHKKGSSVSEQGNGCSVSPTNFWARVGFGGWRGDGGLGLANGGGLWPQVGGIGHGFIYYPDQSTAATGGIGGGDNPTVGFMSKLGFQGFLLQNMNVGLSSFPPSVSVLNADNQRVPRLELGLSQEGHGGVMNSQSLSPILQRMGQRGGENGSGNTANQQEQNYDDDLQESGD